MSATSACWRGCSGLPAVTRDGTEIALFANLELPRELAAGIEAGAQGRGPAAHRVHVHEPRRPARRGGAVSGLARPWWRGWRAGPSPPAPSTWAATSWPQALAGPAEARRQPGAGPARHPPLAQGAPAPGRPARRHPARRGPWPVRILLPMISSLARAAAGARGHAAGRAAPEAARAASSPIRCRRWAS